MTHPPRVTVVVVPRERFSAAARSLTHLLAVTPDPFDLVYVDGGSPPAVALELRAVVGRAGGRLIRRERFLTPNEARNLGVAACRTEYVVFVDNDVVVERGWLTALVRAADETRGDIVGPLICFGTPLHEKVHCSGGAAHLVPSPSEPGRFRLVDVMAGAFRERAALAPELSRTRTEVFEFHCVLFRADVFARLGPLDEALTATREHIDVCLLAQRHGLTVWIEPSSVVTYLGAKGLRPWDVPYYMLRWSNAWQRASLEHMKSKWRLDDESIASGLRGLAGRRKEAVVRPLVARLTRGRGSRALERALMGVDLVAERLLTATHARRLKRARG